MQVGRWINKEISRLLGQLNSKVDWVAKKYRRGNGSITEEVKVRTDWENGHWISTKNQIFLTCFIETKLSC